MIMQTPIPILHRVAVWVRLAAILLAVPVNAAPLGDQIPDFEDLPMCALHVQYDKPIGVSTVCLTPHHHSVSLSGELLHLNRRNLEFGTSGPLEQAAPLPAEVTEILGRLRACAAKIACVSQQQFPEAILLFSEISNAPTVRVARLRGDRSGILGQVLPPDLAYVFHADGKVAVLHAQDGKWRLRNTDFGFFGIAILPATATTL